MGLLIRVFTGIQPVFKFMGNLWTVFPLPIRIVIGLFMATAVGYVMIRNLLL